MGAGLIIGNVFSKKGSRLSNVDIRLIKIQGMGMGEIGFSGEKMTYNGMATAKTNGRGYFHLPFTWSGAEIGEAIGTSSTLDISIYAFKAVRSGNTEMNYGRGGLIKGFLLRDVLAVGAVNPAPLQSIPDLLGFAKDAIESLRKLKSLPMFKSELASTESWLIISATDIFIEI